MDVRVWMGMIWVSVTGKSSLLLNVGHLLGTLLVNGQRILGTTKKWLKVSYKGAWLRCEK